LSSDGFSPNAIGLRERPVSIEPAHEIRGGSRLIERGAKTRGFGETADIQWRRFALIAVYDFRSLSGAQTPKCQFVNRSASSALPPNRSVTTSPPILKV
jgi:hypothetical protein